MLTLAGHSFNLDGPCFILAGHCLAWLESGLACLESLRCCKDARGGARGLNAISTRSLFLCEGGKDGVGQGAILPLVARNHAPCRCR